MMVHGGMQMNEAGINLIKSFEGCKLKSYKCPAGIWTIGYGHTGSLKGHPLTMGMVITQEQAEELLRIDLKKFEKAVDDLKRNFNENQHAALVSFTYNCGPGKLKTLCKNRTNAQIADALLLYNKGGGKVLDGLTRRRKAERALFLTPVSSKPKEVKEESKPKLPYQVRTVCDLNARKGPGTNYARIRTMPKGTVLTIWAEQTVDGVLWGKNGNEYYCLRYCEKL